MCKAPNLLTKQTKHFCTLLNFEPVQSLCVDVSSHPVSPQMWEQSTHPEHDP